MAKINQEEYEKIKLLPDYDWNWIAREKTGKILSFTNKPTKTDEVWKDKQTRLWFNYKDSQLFQFIQWEDEEPYNIAELIEEYDRRGGKMMKKDIEWLKDKIRSERECLALSLSKGQETMREYNFNNGKHGALVDVLKLIDQLDEPEVLSQEWIDENKFEVNGWNEAVHVEDLQNLIVPKQEELESKIKVLIEAYKQEEDAYSNPENGWISGFIEDLKNLVEEEQKYYALIKGHELLADHDALSFTYWNFNMSNGYLLHGNKFSKQARFLTKMTKEDWNKLGINDSNADFVNVEN